LSAGRVSGAACGGFGAPLRSLSGFDANGHASYFESSRASALFGRNFAPVQHNWQEAGAVRMTFLLDGTYEPVAVDLRFEEGALRRELRKQATTVPAGLEASIRAALAAGDARAAEAGLMVFFAALVRGLALEADRQLADAHTAPATRVASGGKILEAIWRYYNLVDFAVSQRDPKAATAVRLAFEEAESYVKAPAPAPEPRSAAPVPAPPTPEEHASGTVQVIGFDGVTASGSVHVRVNSFTHGFTNLVLTVPGTSTTVTLNFDNTSEIGGSSAFASVIGTGLTLKVLDQALSGTFAFTKASDGLTVTATNVTADIGDATGTAGARGPPFLHLSSSGPSTFHVTSAGTNGTFDATLTVNLPGITAGSVSHFPLQPSTCWKGMYAS